MPVSLILFSMSSSLSLSLPLSPLGATVEVYFDENRKFKGLFFQDGPMSDAFRAYPEIVFIDATYKLLELGIPTYLFCARIRMAKVKLLVFAFLCPKTSTV